MHLDEIKTLDKHHLEFKSKDNRTLDFWCLPLMKPLILSKYGGFSYQEKDLKQYMDDCGGIMSMNNVRVSNFNFLTILLKPIQSDRCLD